MHKIEKIDEQIKSIETKLADPKLCENTASISSRITGYYRQTRNWHDGKKAEFRQRNEYSIEEC